MPNQGGAGGFLHHAHHAVAHLGIASREHNHLVLLCAAMSFGIPHSPYEILKPKVEEQPKEDDDKYEDNTQETKSLPVNNE